MSYAFSILCLVAAVFTWLEGMLSTRVHATNYFTWALMYIVVAYCMWMRPWEVM